MSQRIRNLIFGTSKVGNQPVLPSSVYVELKIVTVTGGGTRVDIIEGELLQMDITHGYEPCISATATDIHVKLAKVKQP